MIFSIVHNKIEDNFIVEADTIPECQTKTISGLIKKGWDMGDCHSVPLDEPLGKTMADCLDKLLNVTIKPNPTP